MASSIIAHAWFTGATGTVGVIITHDPINHEEPFKARIGSAPTHDEEAGLIVVRDRGTKIKVFIALLMVLEYGEWDIDKDNPRIQECIMYAYGSNVPIAMR